MTSWERDGTDMKPTFVSRSLNMTEHEVLFLIQVLRPIMT